MFMYNHKYSLTEGSIGEYALSNVPNKANQLITYITNYINRRQKAR
jgi:hypothetical protein